MVWRRRKQREQDLERELRSDLELEAAEQQASGLTPEEARYAARRAFGNTTRVNEEVRQMWGWIFLEAVWQDLHFGSRKLRQNPGFTVTAVLTLALGIGANTAVFSLVNAVLLRSLPGLRSAENLVLFSDGQFEGRFTQNTPDPGILPAYSYPLYKRLRSQLKLFDDIAAQQSNTTGAVVQSAAGDGSGTAEPASARCVTENYFDVLGVPALVGRTFRTEDQTVPGANPIVVLSYGYWQRQFGGNPEIIGTQLTINGFPYTVVGVTPRHFTGTKIGAATDFWVPITMQAQFMRREFMLSPTDKAWWLLVIGRLKPGVSLRQAQAELNVAVQQYLAETPVSPEEMALRRLVRAELFSGSKGVVSPRQQFGPSLLVLTGAVGLLLMIACINVSHLLLARSVRRQPEVSLKLALGASRARIARQLVTEGLLLSALGGVAGVAFGQWCISGLVRLVSTGQELFAVDTTPDVRVLVFSCLLILAIAVLFGLVPIYQTFGTELSGSLKSMSRTVTGGAGHRAFTRLLLISQVALSFLLLIGAGLLTQSLRNLEKVDKGFREDHVLLINLNSRLTGLNPRQLEPVYESLLGKISSLPVESASMATDAPLSGNTSTTDISVRGALQGDDTEVQEVVATPLYFETMRMSLIQGRGFSHEDRESTPRVAVINEAMAKRFFNSGGVLGRRFRAGGQDQELTVAGVVKNARTVNLRTEPRPTMYLPLAQSPETLRSLQVRTAADPAMLATEIRRIIRKVNANLAVNRVITLQQQVNRSLVRERMIATLAGAFGFLALILVCVGVYGVLSQRVAQRTAEIGVRLALGASQRGVQWLMLRELLALILWGAAIGMPGAFAVGKGMRSLLFELSPLDPRTLTVATASILIFTVVASYIPAWRASRVDPMVALRYE